MAVKKLFDDYRYAIAQQFKNKSNLIKISFMKPFAVEKIDETYA